MYRGGRDSAQIQVRHAGRDRDSITGLPEAAIRRSTEA